MLDSAKMHSHSDVVWSGSCQTTGSLRRYLEEKQMGEAPKIPRTPYLDSKKEKENEDQHKRPVFSGILVAPTEYDFDHLGAVKFKASEFRRFRGFKLMKTRAPGTTTHFQTGPGSQASNNIEANGDAVAASQRRAENITNTTKHPATGNSGEKRNVPLFSSSEPGVSETRQISRGRSAPPLRFAPFSQQTPRIEELTSRKAAMPNLGTVTVADAICGGQHLTSENEKDAASTNGRHKFSAAQRSWRSAMETIRKNPEKREISSAHEHILAKSISVPKKFTNQELAAQVVTAMKNPSPKTHRDDAERGTIGNLTRSQIRAQSAPVMVRGCSRREMQRRFSSEAWYQKALSTLREIPAYVPKGDEGHCNDLEEIAKRLCRTTAASRAREAATSKVVYREPVPSRESIHNRAERSKPNRKLVTADMINNMLRFKGQRHVPGANMHEIVERLSSCEPSKIPDARRTVPPENLHRVGIMNTLSWKGKDPFQREGVNTAGLEALVQRLSEK